MMDDESPIGTPDPVEINPALLNRLSWKLRWSDRKRSRDLARRVLLFERDNAIERGLAWRTLAWQARWAGRLQRTEELSHTALVALEAAPPGAGPALADVQSALGVIRYSRHENDGALAAVETGRVALAAEDDVESRIDLLVTESTTLRYLDRREPSLERLVTAVGLAEGASLGRVRHNLARWYLTEGDVDAALAQALPAVALCRRWDNRVVLPYALEVLGACYARIGRRQRAEECFAEGLEIAADDGDLRVECQILQEAGHLALLSGEEERGRQLLHRGLLLARSLGYSLWEEGFEPRGPRMLSVRVPRRPQTGAAPGAAAGPMRTERRQKRLIIVRAAVPRPRVNPSQIPTAPSPTTNPKT